MEAVEEKDIFDISGPFEIKKKNRLFGIKSPSKIFMETGRVDIFKNGGKM